MSSTWHPNWSANNLCHGGFQALSVAAGAHHERDLPARQQPQRGAFRAERPEGL